MVFGFGKKTKEEDVPIKPSLEPPSDIPVDKVIAMRQQGISNSQIVQTLQKDGYRSDQVFDAMNQADIKGSVGPVQPTPFEPSQIENPMPPLQQPQSQTDTKERIEELAEVIIDEKWNELVKDINKMIEWKEKIESKTDAMEQKITDLANNLDSLNKSILQRVNQYDKNITNVGTDLKAMEQVFSKILPKFTENVNELSRITQSAKKKKN